MLASDGGTVVCGAALWLSDHGLSSQFLYDSFE